MSGDRAVGLAAIFVAGWLAGQWTAGHERPEAAVTTVPSKQCVMPAYPPTRKAAKAWAKHREDASEVILQ